MRAQSTFEKIAQGTSQQLFAVCFVILRIAVGLAFIYLAIKLTQMTGADVASDIEPGTPSYAMQLADLRAIKILFSPILIGLAVLFVCGLLVRPVSVVAIGLIALNAFTSGSINPEGVIVGHGLLMLGFLLFAAGGSGHVLGLDGIISRNIRHPNMITRFLFG